MTGKTNASAGGNILDEITPITSDITISNAQGGANYNFAVNNLKENAVYNFGYLKGEYFSTDESYINSATNAKILKKYKCSCIVQATAESITINFHARTAANGSRSHTFMFY